MQCSLFPTPSGPAMVCSRGPRPKSCRHCSNVSTLLCDYPTRNGGTCSAPICKACALHAGEEIDYCRDHASSVSVTPGGRRIIVGSLRDLDALSGERVDRGRSALGNPFVLKGERHREDCVEQYRQWLWSQLAKFPDGLEDSELRHLARLALKQDVLLLCWCAPRNCHARVIARAILWHLAGRPATKGAKV